MEETKKCTCPLCGSDQYVEPNLDEDVKDAFIEHMLGGVPFTRTYDEMGGRISVTASAIPDNVVRSKGKLMMKILRVAEYTPDIQLRLPVFEACVDTDCQIVSIAIKDKNGDIKRTDRIAGKGLEILLSWDWDKLTPEQASTKFDEAIEVLDNSLFPNLALPKSILRAAVGKHNTLLTKLMTECFDENFLRGTGREY